MVFLSIEVIVFLSTTLVLTNKRIIGRLGVFNKVRIDSPIDAISSIMIQKKILGKIFNYAKIILTTAHGEQIVFHDMVDAEKFEIMYFNERE